MNSYILRVASLLRVQGSGLQNIELSGVFGAGRTAALPVSHSQTTQEEEDADLGHVITGADNPREFLA